ncbi:MAG: hypothetical protein WCP28_14675 [Actinomycetes bacterium]
MRIVRWRGAPYLLAALITAAVALWFLQPWGMAAGDVFSGGEDIVALQTNITEAAQTGPFGTNPHIAYPVGENLWSFPQSGMAILIGGWLLSGVLGIGSGATILWLMMLTLVATACATLFLFRAVIGDRQRVLAATLAAAVGLSPFFVYKIGHLNVATIFAVPLVLGLLLRARDRSVRWWVLAAVATAVAVAISPVWWGIVLLLVLATVGVGVLLQRSWQRVLAVAVTGAGVAVGVGVQVLLFRSARVPGASFGRGLWGANTFGGKFADLLLSSPLLDRLLSPSAWGRIARGASVELKPIGIVCALAFVALVLLLIKVTPAFVRLDNSDRDGSPRVDTTFLTVMSVVVVLFFVVGGLGNAQASVGALLGIASPARTFSRMSIIIAMLGLAWFLLYFNRWRERTRLSGRSGQVVTAVVVAAVIVVSIADLSAVPRPPTAASSAMAESGAIEFLRANTTPCPVAQLPQDGAPIPRPIGGKGPTTEARAEFNEQFYYRGYYPYLLATDYFWSIGSYHEGATTALNAIGTTLTQAGSEKLREAGFCAILYDKTLAARPGAKDLEGVLVAGMPTPDFVSPRYDVYLLENRPADATAR